MSSLKNALLDLNACLSEKEMTIDWEKSINRAMHWARKELDTELKEKNNLKDRIDFYYGLVLPDDFCEYVVWLSFIKKEANEILKILDE